MTTTDQLSISEIQKLAAELGQPLIFFDFETTTLRGRPNFGIWEAAFLAVLPNGQARSYSALMDPEAPLDPQVAQMCGMSDAVLRGRKPFAAAVLPHFQEYAPVAWFGGFNVKTFDVPAAKEMAQKAGQAEPDFRYVFDVRPLHHELLQTGAQKGTLVEVAKAYRVAPRGALHRAEADVALTAETFNAMLRTYGAQRVLQAMQAQNQPGRKGSPRKLGAATAARIAEYVQGKEICTSEELAKHFGMEPEAIGFELGKAIDERLVAADVFANAEAQDWLELSLPLVPSPTLAEGRLKAIYGLVAEGAPSSLDYVQLRIALIRSGHCWSTLKPVPA